MNCLETGFGTSPGAAFCCVSGSGVVPNRLLIVVERHAPAGPEPRHVYSIV